MRRKISVVLALVAGAILVSGCHLDMWVQGKVKPQAKSELYSDNLASRLEPKGVIAYDAPKLDTEFYSGYTGSGALVKTFPIKVTPELMHRGRDRFMAFCSPCHGQTGNGKGMIAQRGFAAEKPIATYHTDRLRQIPVGHFFSVITNGYGAMYPFGSRIQPKDRWAIAAYIRALQKSQDSPAASLTAEEQGLLNKPMPEPSHKGGEEGH